MMNTKIRLNLGSVQKTLLLPLWGRARESRKKNPLLIDRTAAEIIERIDYDFTVISKNIHPITQLAWIARALHIDRAVRDFLGHHPHGTIVNVGCGLDTTFERIDNGMLRWYDLDLSDVIALRRQFVTDSQRRSHLACSFLDEAWLSELDTSDSVMFIAAGVFYYFEEQQMREFLPKLAKLFPGGTAVFDVASPFGLRAANKKVLEAGGMDRDAVLKWAIESAEELHSWDSRIVVDEEFPMFHGIKGRLRIGEMFGAAISDHLKIMSIVRLSFSP